MVTIHEDKYVGRFNNKNNHVMIFGSLKMLYAKDNAHELGKKTI